MIFYTPYISLHSIKIIKIISAQMSPNVPGCKRRFASPDKGLWSKAGAGKLWRSEAWERAKRPT
jgi:hypothetical protein